ncbi:hypothetical protein [Bifidobacterium pseudocatenulatum]|jgi:hypothetical protein|nr:hypothetical protein [Bifidobacterium pseudocatenulatum]
MLLFSNHQMHGPAAAAFAGAAGPISNKHLDDMALSEVMLRI